LSSHQLLFIDASMAVQNGGEGGACRFERCRQDGDFPIISGQMQPDDGAVLVDAGKTIGYFRQDVGEMSGRPAVAVVMGGAGPVSALAAEMAAIATLREVLRSPANCIPRLPSITDLIFRLSQ
jgi:ATP-binding cassette subfamily F protein 3